MVLAKVSHFIKIGIFRHWTKICWNRFFSKLVFPSIGTFDLLHSFPNLLPTTKISFESRKSSEAIFVKNWTFRSGVKFIKRYRDNHMGKDSPHRPFLREIKLGFFSFLLQILNDWEIRAFISIARRMKRYWNCQMFIKLS